MRGEERPSWFDKLRSVSRGTCLHPSSGRHIRAPPAPGPVHTSTTQNYAVSRETRSRASARPVDERRMPPLIGPAGRAAGRRQPVTDLGVAGPHSMASMGRTPARLPGAHSRREPQSRVRVTDPARLKSVGVGLPRQNVTRTVFPVEPHEFMMATAVCSAERTEANVSSPRRTVRSFP